LKEIPNQSEADYEISIRIIWSGVKVVFGSKCGIEMLGFYKNSSLADSSVDEEIEV
jgi:hypothetical protein